MSRLWLGISVMATSLAVALGMLARSQDHPSPYTVVVEAVLGLGLLAALVTLAAARRVANDAARAREAGEQADRVMLERQQFRGMTEMLQTVQTRQEASHILGGHLVRLFPGASGSVYLYAASRDALEPFASWGGADPGHLLPDECWALRLGKAYFSNGSERAMPCLHAADRPQPSVCVPLMANGETVGLFSVEQPADSAAPGADGHELQRRASAVAERLSLPLANLLLRETLRGQSIRDPLTGAFNRRYLEESVVRELTRAVRHHTPLSLVLLDLDHFKRVNDAFGHSVGDNLLRAVGRFLSKNLRGDDIVCRFGGEEFAVVMPGASQEAALSRLDTLRRLIGDVGCDNGQGGYVSVTFSGGVATFPSDGNTLEALVQVADGALYRAKDAGRDMVCGAERPVMSAAAPAPAP